MGIYIYKSMSKVTISLHFFLDNAVTSTTSGSYISHIYAELWSWHWMVQAQHSLVASPTTWNLLTPLIGDIIWCPMGSSSCCLHLLLCVFALNSSTFKMIFFSFRLCFLNLSILMNSDPILHSDMQNFQLLPSLVPLFCLNIISWICFMHNSFASCNFTSSYCFSS